MAKKSIRTLTRLVVVLCALIAVGPAFASDFNPAREDVFKGKIGKSVKDSVPYWRQPPTPPESAPNIVLIMLDDVGFGDTSTFGGVAHTPTLDRLSAEGLRYNRFHTAGVCIPTRAALLTGRNHHRVGYGGNIAGGFPGYDQVWREDTTSVADILKRNGYNTAAFGKWHNTPYSEITAIGPFDRWPTGLGFEYFYGFMTGGVSHWEPNLYRNTTPVEPSLSSKDEEYYLTTDLVDDAIGWVRTQESIAPNKPYFLYFATGAAHSPHHAPKAWIEKYRGRFDQGWDKLREAIFTRQKQLGVIPASTELTPRPEGLAAWATLSSSEKRLFARQMEVYAAMIAYTDHELGRLIQTVREGPDGDNTLILFVVGDNGGSAASLKGGSNLWAERVGSGASVDEELLRLDELGGPLYFNDYAAGWAWAGTTPFQWMKYVASHFGATRNPLVVSWPKRIGDGGGLRSQFTHVNAVAATLYEAAGIPFPEKIDGVEQEPLDGVSFAYSFNDADAPSRQKTQYFEVGGNRAIYHEDWIAAAKRATQWEAASGKPLGDFADDQWELYNVAEDFSQARDLAEDFPQKLSELQDLFDQEALRNDVYPLGAPRLRNQAAPAGERTQFTYYPGFPGGPSPIAQVQQHYRITAYVDIPKGGAEGVLVSSGTRDAGFTLYVREGRLIYEPNFFGRDRNPISSDVVLPEGRSTLAYEFLPDNTDGPSEGIASLYRGVARLYVNDQLVGEGRAMSTWMDFQVGRDSPSPVSLSYRAPFLFTGTIEKVTVDLK